jgi:malate synthase A
MSDVVPAIKPYWRPLVPFQLMSPGARTFLVKLHREFAPRLNLLLRHRDERSDRLARGEPLTFPVETEGIRRNLAWRVPPPPADLLDRRVEIAAPAQQARVALHALNSGAQVWVADLEDAISPNWANLMSSQHHLYAAARRTLSDTATDGHRLRLARTCATIVLRTRGWHLPERHLEVDGQSMVAALVDAGLFAYHCAQPLLERGSAPYFYLPKLEGWLDARLWREVFQYLEHALELPDGCIRATALIETITAAYEMEEILYALGPYAAGLTAGRWDYFFSIARTFRQQGDYVFPDRAQLTMASPFMRAYTDRLIDVCHRRGAHALGGVAPQIPDRHDPAQHARVCESVRQEKEREAMDGFDGSWVVHPDLVPMCRKAFDQVLDGQPHQIRAPAAPLDVHPDELDARGHLAGNVTEAGLRDNLAVSLRYLYAWLRGSGSVRLEGLMEGTATVEIARAQIWQWLHHGTRLADGRMVTRPLLDSLLDEEMARFHADTPAPLDAHDLAAARGLLEAVAMTEAFPSFLTLPGYELLLAREGSDD